MPHTPPQIASGVVARPERRADKRAALARPVLVDTADASAPSRGLDVSRGGLAIETELELVPGQAVGVYFELPIGYAVEARAIVARRSGRLVGLRFAEMDRETEIALRSFCRISGLHALKKP